MIKVFKSSIFILFALLTTACSGTSSSISAISSSSSSLPCNGKYIGFWREVDSKTNEPMRENGKEMLIEFRADGRVKADHGFQSITLGYQPIPFGIERADGQLPIYRCLEGDNVLFEMPRWQIVKGEKGDFSVEVAETRIAAKLTLDDNRLKIVRADQEFVYERLGPAN